jgi:hypothetical protein
MSDPTIKEQLNDSTIHPGIKTREGIELSKDTEETSKTIDSISNLAERIQSDKPITEEDMDNLENTLDKALESSMETLRIKARNEFQDIPVLGDNELDELIKNNLPIWQEILNDNYENHDKLTLLIPEAAEHLSGHEGDLWLSGLQSISDTTAEHLSRHEGYLYLNGLQSISDTTAEHLSRHKGSLGLFGLQSISDTTAEHLSRHEGYLYLNGLQSISDTGAGYFNRNFNFRRFILYTSSSVKQKILKAKS